MTRCSTPTQSASPRQRNVHVEPSTSGIECSRRSWSIASGEAPSLRNRARACCRCEGAGLTLRLPPSPRTRRPSGATTTARRCNTRAVRELNSRRSPASRTTHTLGANRAASSARSSASWPCNRFDGGTQQGRAPRHRCRCRTAPRVATRCESSSMTTIRSKIAMQPDDHARSGCVSMRAARLQRCRQSFSTPTWPPAIAIAAHSPTIDAASFAVTADHGSIVRWMRGVEAVVRRPDRRGVFWSRVVTAAIAAPSCAPALPGVSAKRVRSASTPSSAARSRRWYCSRNSSSCVRNRRSAFCVLEITAEHVEPASVQPQVARSAAETAIDLRVVALSLLPACGDQGDRSVNPERLDLRRQVNRVVDGTEQRRAQREARTLTVWPTTSSI